MPLPILPTKIEGEDLKQTDHKPLRIPLPRRAEFAGVRLKFKKTEVLSLGKPNKRIENLESKRRLDRC